MGACTFDQLVVGRFKNMNEAYRQALSEAKEENGHQQGYSGDIQTVDYPTFKNDHPRYGTKAFNKWEGDLLNDMDKRECAVIELTGALLKRAKDMRGYKGCKGIKAFYFFGLASC